MPKKEKKKKERNNEANNHKIEKRVIATPLTCSSIEEKVLVHFRHMREQERKFIG